MSSTTTTAASVLDSRLQVASPRVEARPVEKHTYAQILKSTALIGGSSFVNIGFGIVRNKAMAILLGPAGVGLMGLYASVSDLTYSLADMGIQSSGVRQIAEARGSGEAARIARTAIVLRRVSVVLGLLGALVLIALAKPISLLTFGSSQHATGVALLGIAVFFRQVAAGQGALVQGMRRIADLARISVIGPAVGTAISIPLVFLFRERAIVPSLIAVASLSVLASWWYSRKVQIEATSVTFADVRHEAAALLKLGTAFMASAFLTMGAAYAIRLIVVRSSGFEAAGLYQAAWALGGIYVGFILTAMGSDFYPRLTAVANDNAVCNRLVNEQAQISLLLAGPGALATLTLAPLVIALFYSPKFYPAVIILRWVCLGMTLRVISWPMGFIVLAKGAQKIFFWTEVAAAVVHVGLAWLLVPFIGVYGAGAAFFGLYVWHSVLIYMIVRRLSGFRWSKANRTLAVIFLPLTAVVFCSAYLLPPWLATAIGIVAVLASGIYSLRTLLKLFPPDSVPSAIRPWLPRLGLATSTSDL
jgi:antigen flippase